MSTKMVSVIHQGEYTLLGKGDLKSKVAFNLGDRWTITHSDRKNVYIVSNMNIKMEMNQTEIYSIFGLVHGL